ncbi:NADPH:quinone oxidoreductase family protein [Trujillonella endophytica]|uniref:NADPH2:quinone reductase n=1 Tax=Trujillonella endophytica TaxID=673521 RepID=A0A1H8PFV0_9ACTN|nr:NADPH:quinone oxidoreductase family protein [Trujillella endophytica]SEO40790.1 NADPH2:quinone reductase [Trujillella endophytica]
MRAVQIQTLDGPEAVRLAEVDEPAAGGDKVVVDVHVAGVSFPEVLQSRGEYQIKPPVPFVPGSEVAGVVRYAPEGAAVRAGDRVAAFPGTGGFAEVAAADPRLVLPLPDTVSFAQGAAMPMNYLTVHFALTRRGQLGEGQTVLVQGAAGGVGTAAVQLAAALGARVIAVVSSEDKVGTARAAGASDVVLADGFRDRVKELTGGRGVDLVVDPVGGDRFTDSLRSLAVEGRLLVIGFTGGEIPTVKVNRLLLNNISVVGVGWGAYWMSTGPEYVQEQWADLLPLLRAGRLDPVLGTQYPLDQAAQALLELDERRARGKVLLTVR